MSLYILEIGFQNINLCQVREYKATTDVHTHSGVLKTIAVLKTRMKYMALSKV